MAKYDPKRPRPTLGDDEVAPVEALIESVPVDPSDSVEETPSPAELVEEAPADDAPAPAAEEAASAGPGDEGAGTHVSDVPVMPPPEEGTANRAVLAAAGIGTALIVAIAILLRIKRRKG